MSISKAQAEALADGFLDSIGSGSIADLRPREAFSELFLLAGEFIEDCQKNLKSSNSNASGELSASLVANEPELDGRIVKMDVFMNFYGAFVNKGVKGTKSGHSDAGYSFKTDFPSKDMIKAIKGWIDRGKISTMSVKKYKGHGRHETKNKKLAVLSVADASYGIARSIKMHGIKKTGFLDKAIYTTANKVHDRLGAALKIDIINSLKL